jgi:murein DD-endopeptidase MepM/ murein hydrolase activator NlpD
MVLFVYSRIIRLGRRAFVLIQKLVKRFKLKQRFTFIIVPHSNTSVIKMNFTKIMVLGLLAAFVVTMVASGVFLVRYNRMNANMDELTQLREINEEQKEQLEVLASETEEIYIEIEKLRELDQQVREILKIEPREETSLLDVNAVGSEGLSRPIATGGPVTRGTTRDYASVVQGDLEYLKAELIQWESNLEKLNEQAEKHVAFIAAKPAGWPASGRITSGFGNRRSPTGRGSEFHLGIDIANSRGTPIRATGSGKVISAGWQGGYGWTVVVDHGYGYQTLYAHATSLNAKVGDRVVRGTIIAYMGTSGRATGPHVHYEVLYRGENVDPAKFLKK